MSYVRIKNILIAAVICFSSGNMKAEAVVSGVPADIENKDEKEKLQIGGFVDTYYAYDIEKGNKKKQDRDREYFTQAARHNDPNINLAYIDISKTTSEYRGRFAVQYGTSVAANALGETVDSKVSNQASVRNIQEAYAGFKVTGKTWIDAGIYGSHLGFADFISKNNWTYTRSMMAEFSPYYLSGVRLSQGAGSYWTFQLHAVTGWGNVTDNNRDKSAGISAAYTKDRFHFTYGFYAGNEQPDDAPYLHRYFNDLVFKYEFNSKWKVLLSIDLGYEKKPASENAFYGWQAGALIIRYEFTSKAGIAVRYEKYRDPWQIIVQTGKDYGFEVAGGSINFDYKIYEPVLLRFEYKYLEAVDPVFSENKNLTPFDRVAVMSAAISF